MIVNIYSYEQLVKNYPEDNFILELSQKGDSGLYTIYGDPRRDLSGKIILKICPVNIIQ